MEPTTAAAVPAQTGELGPRAKAFAEKAKATRVNITKEVYEWLRVDLDLSPAEIIAKRVTPQGQQEINSLDQRVQILFTNILVDVFMNIAAQKILPGLFAISMGVGDEKAHAKYVKEAGLPYIKALVADLDANYPGVIDEAVSVGITNPPAVQLFGLL
jgi:hypothetical protein